MQRKKIGLAALLVLLMVGYFKLGIYTFPPMGVAPEGKTIIVWRQGEEPFFNSPEAMCHLIGANITDFGCRFGAVINAPIERILVRLPYQDWAHKASLP